MLILVPIYVQRRDHRLIVRTCVHAVRKRVVPIIRSGDARLRRAIAASDVQRLRRERDQFICSDVRLGGRLLRLERHHATLSCNGNEVAAEFAQRVVPLQRPYMTDVARGARSEAARSNLNRVPNGERHQQPPRHFLR